MADELPDSIPAAIPATDPSQRPPHVQGEIDGMRAVPDTGCEPWATRLDPPHPGHVAKAAGALTAITASRKHAYMVAYTLDDAGLLAVDGERDLSALADACDDLVRAYHARDANSVPPAVIEAVRVALGQPVGPIVDGDALREHAEDLWSALDWTLWGHGLGNVLRERMADTMLAALPAADLDQALQLMRVWKERRGYPVLHEQFAQLRSEVATMAADALSAEQRADRTIQGLRADLEHENRMVQQARRKALKLQDELNELRSRPAIPADTVVLPENWRQQLGWLFTVEDAGKWTRTCRLVEMWQGKRLGTDDDSNPVVDSNATSVHGVTTPGVVDGDLLRDLLADMAPPEWQDAAAGAHAEKVLAEMHRVGVTVLRGPMSKPWTPPGIDATATCSACDRGDCDTCDGCAECAESTGCGACPDAGAAANESVDAVIERMSKFIGKRVEMSFPPTDYQVSRDEPGVALTGTVSKVRANVWIEMDYGSGLDALGEGFEIREIPAVHTGDAS